MTEADDVHRQLLADRAALAEDVANLLDVEAGLADVLTRTPEETA